MNAADVTQTYEELARIYCRLYWQLYWHRRIEQMRAEWIAQMDAQRLERSALLWDTRYSWRRDGEEPRYNVML